MTEKQFKTRQIAPNHNLKTVQNGTEFEKKNVLEKRTYGRTSSISRQYLRDLKKMYRKISIYFCQSFDNDHMFITN